jgi:hypothetical protein
MTGSHSKDGKRRAPRNTLERVVLLRTGMKLTTSDELGDALRYLRGVGRETIFLVNGSPHTRCLIQSSEVNISKTTHYYMARVVHLRTDVSRVLLAAGRHSVKPWGR